MMAVEILVPLGFFAMIAYIAKLIGDTRIRRKVLDSAASEEMADALLSREWPAPRTRLALKWGLVLFSLGVGVLFVDIIAIGFESPMAYAILLLAAGAALLAFYAIERDDRREDGEQATMYQEEATGPAEPVRDPEL